MLYITIYKKMVGILYVTHKPYSIAAWNGQAL